MTWLWMPTPPWKQPFSVVFKGKLSVQLDIHVQVFDNITLDKRDIFKTLANELRDYWDSKRWTKPSCSNSSTIESHMAWCFFVLFIHLFIYIYFYYNMILHTTPMITPYLRVADDLVINSTSTDIVFTLRKYYMNRWSLERGFLSFSFFTYAINFNQYCHYLDFKLIRCWHYMLHVGIYLPPGDRFLQAYQSVGWSYVYFPKLQMLTTGVWK